MSPVAGSTSVKITSPSTNRTQLAVARKVVAGTATRSPGPTPSPSMAR